MTFLNGTHADHPLSDPDWGYKATWRWLYPERSGVLYWKAWTVDEEPVPQRDALILIDVVEQTWEPMFNYALAAGGYRAFDFDGVPHVWFADANYARMNTTLQVEYFCGTGSIVACMRWDPDDTDWDSTHNRVVLLRADIVYGPEAYGVDNSKFRHVLAHEWGHGFGLAHHNGVCGYVMSSVYPLQCTDMPAAADIATALDTVYGY